MSIFMSYFMLPWNFTYHTRGEDIVEVLKEGFLFDLLVCEEERDALALVASHAVQGLEVLQQVGHIV